MWVFIFYLFKYLLIGTLFFFLARTIIRAMRGTSKPNPRASQDPISSPKNLLCSLCQEPLDPKKPAAFLQDDHFHLSCLEVLKTNLRKRKFCGKEEI